MTEEEVEEIINDWLKEWCVLVPEDQIQQEEEEQQQENLDAGKEEEYPPEDLDSVESHSKSTSTDPKTKKEGEEPQKEQA